MVEDANRTCVKVVLAHILVIVRQFYPNEERSGLIDKVNICRCTENAAFCHDGSDTDGLKWSFGFDRFYRRRRHLGFSKGQGFSLRHGKKSSCSLIFGLILIAGDVAQNLGPSRNLCGECGETVKRNEKGVCCEICLCWFHACCLEIKDEDYVKCTKRATKWLFLDCERSTSTGRSSNDDADENMYEMTNNLKKQGLKVAHLNVDWIRSKLSS